MPPTKTGRRINITIEAKMKKIDRILRRKLYNWDLSAKLYAQLETKRDTSCVSLPGYLSENPNGKMTDLSIIE